MINANEARQRVYLRQANSSDLNDIERKIKEMSSVGFFNVCVGNLTEESQMILKSQGYVIDYIPRGLGCYRISWFSRESPRKRHVRLAKSLMKYLILMILLFLMLNLAFQ